MELRQALSLLALPTVVSIYDLLEPEASNIISLYWVSSTLTSPLLELSVPQATTALIPRWLLLLPFFQILLVNIIMIRPHSAFFQCIFMLISSFPLHPQLLLPLYLYCSSLPKKGTGSHTHKRKCTTAEKCLPFFAPAYNIILQCHETFITLYLNKKV